MTEGWTIVNAVDVRIKQRDTKGRTAAVTHVLLHPRNNIVIVQVCQYTVQVTIFFVLYVAFQLWRNRVTMYGEKIAEDSNCSWLC